MSQSQRSTATSSAALWASIFHLEAPSRRRSVPSVVSAILHRRTQRPLALHVIERLVLCENYKICICSTVCVSIRLSLLHFALFVSPFSILFLFASPFFSLFALATRSPAVAFSQRCCCRRSYFSICHYFPRRSPRNGPFLFSSHF